MRRGGDCGVDHVMAEMRQRGRAGFRDGNYGIRLRCDGSPDNSPNHRREDLRFLLTVLDGNFHRHGDGLWCEIWSKLDRCGHISGKFIRLNSQGDGGKCFQELPLRGLGNVGPRYSLRQPG